MYFYFGKNAISFRAFPREWQNCVAAIGDAFFGAQLRLRTFYLQEDKIMSAYAIGAILGSIISGAIVGAIPAICGAIKHKLGLAIGGFFACLVGSLLLGLILSVPLCAVFLFFIFKKPRKKDNEFEE